MLLRTLLAITIGALCQGAALDATVVRTEAELTRALGAAAPKIAIAGRIEIHRPVEVKSDGAELSGGELAVSPDFQGSAAILVIRRKNIVLTGITITGNRQSMTSGVSLPPSDVAFADFHKNNGILIRDSSHVRIQGGVLRRIHSFPILVYGGSDVTVAQVSIEDSGTLNGKGRNNTTGGILFEEGTSDFVVRDCIIRRVPGNGIWTHSRMDSPRLRNGLIQRNTITDVARDALQAGHATNVRIEDNRGARVGFPAEYVDMDAQAVPVAIDTAGDVDASVYARNTFTDVNGKCIDLDGFHDGKVLANNCTNLKPLSSYPHSHYAIVFNNSNPNMRPANVTVERNVMRGFAYGGVFLIGSNHKVINNRFLDLNRARCTGDMAVRLCNYAPEEPGMLRSGIFLGDGADRPAVTRANQISGNTVTGFGMRRWCIGAARSVALSENAVGHNSCLEGNRQP